VPDRFLVGLAVLSLLSEAAGERPLICVVDDEQWLDRASAQALGFAARRLAADPVGVVFAARVPDPDVAGLPELVVEGLAEADARVLLDSVLAAPLDRRVREQIIAETDGNPLALLELPRGLTPTQLAGGFGLGSAVPLDGRIEGSFGRQLAALPAQTRRLVQLAAADPSGDPVLIWRAAGRLGIGAEAAGPAVAAGLAEFGARVRFRHPLVRSAACRSASVSERQQAHGALAEATDPEADPDRRAWHRAQAAPGPDEDVAADLERSAGRAQACGGLAAAAAFLQRAAVLTPEPGRRARRMLAAARATREAGAPEAALGLLAQAEAGPPDGLQAAQLEYLRGQIADDQRRSSDAARTGEVSLVRAALEWLSERTGVMPTEWALGIEAASAPCSATARLPTAATGSRSSAWPAPAVASTWPVLTCCTGSGCTARTAAWTLALSSGPPTTCCPGWGPGRSPSGPGLSWWPPAKRYASGRPRRSASSPARRRTSPGLPSTAAPTAISAPSCTSAPGPSNGTWARYMPSSAWAHAASCARPWPTSGRRTRRLSDRHQDTTITAGHGTKRG
jgi:hypothetical protein